MKCTRKGCKNEANSSSVYGILPCDECQQGDSGFKVVKSPRIYSLSRFHRTQKEQDHHGRDILQPYFSGKPNKDFFKANPDLVDTYDVRKELEKS